MRRRSTLTSSPERVEPDARARVFERAIVLTAILPAYGARRRLVRSRRYVLSALPSSGWIGCGADDAVGDMVGGAGAAGAGSTGVPATAAGVDLVCNVREVISGHCEVWPGRSRRRRRQGDSWSRVSDETERGLMGGLFVLTR
jgi:hypothetical protein